MSTMHTQSMEATGRRSQSSQLDTLAIHVLVSAFRGKAGTSRLVWRANQAVDHCPLLLLTADSYKTVIIKIPLRYSVAAYIRPEHGSQLIAITKALIVSTQ